MLKLISHGITSILAIQFTIKNYYFMSALIKSLYIGIINVIIHVLRVESHLYRNGADRCLAEIAAHFIEFRNAYCCVGNTVVIGTSMIRIKTPHRENKFIKIVN